MKNIFFLLILFTGLGCTNEPAVHPALLNFSVDDVSESEMNRYRKLDPNGMGKILEMKSTQVSDTLVVSFVRYTGNAESYAGDILFRNDSMILLLTHGMGIRELMAHRYTYRVLNTEGTIPPIGFAR